MEIFASIVGGLIILAIGFGWGYSSGNRDGLENGKLITAGVAPKAKVVVKTLPVKTVKAKPALARKVGKKTAKRRK